MEVNVAANSGTDDIIFGLLRAKERELAYQKVILEGCKEELASLNTKIKEEENPEAREELMETAKKFAVALQGKKEHFIITYGEWKTAMLKLDIQLLKQGKISGLAKAVTQR